MFDISVISAFIGGLLTFLAPCTLPLIPAYLAFIGGTTGQSAHGTSVRRNLLLNAVCFILGFSFVFIVFGMASGALGTYLVLYRKILAQIGGVVVILFGISMLGVFTLPSISAGWGGFVPKWLKAGTTKGSFLLGLLFALGWSPCLGPVLGTIYILAVTKGTVLAGGALLFVYSMGLALPFLVVAYLYGSAWTYVGTLGKFLPVISKAGAVLLIVIGLLLVIGQFGMLNTWVINLIGDIGYDRFVELM